MQDTKGIIKKVLETLQKDKLLMTKWAANRKSLLVHVALILIPERIAFSIPKMGTGKR